MASDDNTETRRIIRELDGVLPGEIDRRNFLNTVGGTVGAMMLAGCVGGDDDDGTADGTDGTDDTDDTGDGEPNGFSDDTEAVFTTPWVMEPSWGPAHIAEQQGYWEDEGVPGIDATPGNGSDTESQNIGIGNKEMGIASLTTALSFIPGTDDVDELDMQMMALVRGRPLLSLIWRTDEMEDRADIAGKDILLASGFAAASWDLYPTLVGAEPASAVEAGEELGPISIAQNDFQAAWGSIDLLPAYQAEADVELGVTPLTDFGPFYGFPLWVNGAWFEGKENNVEFMAQVMEGYFKALKWCLLNQDDYLDYLANEINPELQTWTEEELTGQHSVLAAQAVTGDMKEEGLGYYTEDGLQWVIDNAGPALVDDPDTIPSAADLSDRRAWEESNKVTFSDDEWDTLADTAGFVWDIFEEAEASH